MEDSIELPVVYKGKEEMFSGHLKPYGYTYRIVVDVYGDEVYFEPDEERNFRAMVAEGQIDRMITVELLQAIAEAIEEAVK